MAFSNSLCSHQSYASYNAKTQFNSFNGGCFYLPSSFKPHGLSSFHRKFQSSRTNLIRATASDSKTGRKQVEVSPSGIDLEDKFNKLADEVDRDAGLSRLTLFSPCKIHLDKMVPTGLAWWWQQCCTTVGKQISLGCVATEKELQEWSGEIGSISPLLSPMEHLEEEEVKCWMECIDRLSFELIRVEDIPPPVPFDVPMVLIKPPEACSTAEVYKRFRLDQTSQIDPLTLLEKIGRNGISQEVCVNDLVWSTRGCFNQIGLVVRVGGDLFYEVREGPGKEKQLETFESELSNLYFQNYLKEIITEELEGKDSVLLKKEPPAFEVLPSLKRLKQRIAAAGRGQYDAVFMSGSGSTIVGVGSPDPPQFVYDDDEYKNVFLSEANFITRSPNQWYAEPISTNAATSPTETSVQ
ncbi:4-diphosphocytidyl-2-C-methyl-D-erythritol kinase, chloroplastic [Sesamum angolense]|uniref:4-diphosphocytidyl-2-C-methyl-D-erythritol kinase, chloroplastic n=1 Tax=Sesamum angolense TaxID=2727404 RepID=A0AAE1X9L4_9LAMI|nr:4-diphosphocytidyl-2-C-methyl-D-erythritol kinase, chloroplastic [Sesamum angolense]